MDTVQKYMMLIQTFNYEIFNVIKNMNSHAKESLNVLTLELFKIMAQENPGIIS